VCGYGGNLSNQYAASEGWVVGVRWLCRCLVAVGGGSAVGRVLSCLALCVVSFVGRVWGGCGGLGGWGGCCRRAGGEGRQGQEWMRMGGGGSLVYRRGGAGAGGRGGGGAARVKVECMGGAGGEGTCWGEGGRVSVLWGVVDVQHLWEHTTGRV